MGLKLKFLTLLSTNPRFLSSLDVLSEDEGVSMRDRYALGRTRNEVIAAIDDYTTQHNNIVKKLGQPEVELLARRVERLKADPKTAKSPDLIATEQRLAALNGKKDSFAIDSDNPEMWEKYNAALKELGEVEVPIFLDHKIVVPENTRLSGKGMSVLFDIIELPEPKAETPAPAK